MINTSDTIQILKIEKIGKKDLYEVFTSNEERIKVTSDLIVEFRILKGTAYSIEEWDKIKNSYNLSLVLDQAMHYIDYKMRSEKEVITYLEEKGYTPQVINTTINKLKDNLYLDDERYARLYVEQKIRDKMGPGVIKYNLILKGINEEIINQYLFSYDEELMYQNAYDMGVITLNKIIGYPLNKQKEACYSRLQRMGYDASIIKKVMSNIEFSVQNDEILIKEYQKLKDKGFDQNKIITKLLTKGYNYPDIKKIINEN